MNSPKHDPVPSWLQRARAQWERTGDTRPDFAHDTAPGQESVWDYPRPPAIVADTRDVRIHNGTQPIAATNQAIRVLETSHPPSFYLPPSAVVKGVLHTVPGSSHCEWKGQAEYVALRPGGVPVGWRYPSPYPEFADFAGYVSFYPALVECFVADEAVRPQAGGFYGGWITDEIVGPFKGEPGTSGW